MMRNIITIPAKPVRNSITFLRLLITYHREISHNKAAMMHGGITGAGHAKMISRLSESLLHICIFFHLSLSLK